MGAVVVYESMFGNTQVVAEAVAAGLGTVMPVQLLEVGSAPSPDALDGELLVAGAPTHAFGLSREQTRKDAAQRVGRPVLSGGRSMREWLDESGPVQLPVAAFDTHVKNPNLPGWASRAINKRLRSLGGQPVIKPASFYVRGYDGPLLPAEDARARAWGARLGALVVGAGSRG